MSSYSSSNTTGPEWTRRWKAQNINNAQKLDMLHVVRSSETFSNCWPNSFGDVLLYALERVEALSSRRRMRRSSRSTSKWGCFIDEMASLSFFVIRDFPSWPVMSHCWKPSKAHTDTNFFLFWIMPAGHGAENGQNYPRPVGNFHHISLSIITSCELSYQGFPNDELHHYLEEWTRILLRSKISISGRGESGANRCTKWLLKRS